MKFQCTRRMSRLTARPPSGSCAKSIVRFANPLNHFYAPASARAGTARRNRWIRLPSAPWSPPLRPRPRRAEVHQRGDHVLFGRAERASGRRGRGGAIGKARPGRACRAAPAPCAPRFSCRRRGCAPVVRSRRSGSPSPDRRPSVRSALVIASFGPMPLTVISFSNSALSLAAMNPNSDRASSRTWVWMCSCTGWPFSGSDENAETGIVTS